MHIVNMNSFCKRLIGLMFKNEIEHNLFLFRKCRSIHTCFMFQNINVFGLDKDYCVVQVSFNVKPWRICLFGSEVKHIVESNVTVTRKEVETALVDWRCYEKN